MGILPGEGSACLSDHIGRGEAEEMVDKEMLSSLYSGEDSLVLEVIQVLDLLEGLLDPPEPRTE